MPKLEIPPQYVMRWFGAFGRGLASSRHEGVADAELLVRRQRQRDIELLKQIRLAPSFDEVVDLLQREVGFVNLIHTTTALHRIAVLTAHVDGQGLDSDLAKRVSSPVFQQVLRLQS